MEDLIKIAPNGQWTLEKAKMPDEERKAMVEQYLARRKAQQEANPAPAPGAPPAGSPTMRQSTEGLRPAQQGGENPDWSKEQLAAFRAGLPANVVDRAGNKQQFKAKTAQEQQMAHGQRTQTRLEREQAEADAKAKATQGRKAAWEATAQFLGDKGESKGYASLAENMQQKKLLDRAHAANAKGEAMEVRPRLPPMAPFVDPKTGVRSMQPRQGTFHGEGAVTTGKIKSKGVGYPDKETGEMKYRSVPQVEKHHWSWDHNNKKWNHVKTTLENPTVG
jgi:hypothetical protein